MRFPVRSAEEADVATLLEILQTAPEAGDWSEADLRLSLVRPSTRQCLVAQRDDGLVGLLLVERAVREEAEILTLAVAPAARRQGVARALLESFLRSSPGRVFLEVRRSNRAAQRLYAGFGFAPAGVRARYYRAPPEDALILEWEGTG